MKYKNLDIKTVDLFFEIFSDPKKFTERMKEMRTARDEIREALEVSDTKDKANNLLEKAESKMAEATAYEAEMTADTEMAAAELAEDIKSHKEMTNRDSDELLEIKKRLSIDRGQFTRTSTALRADLDKGLADVARREDDVVAAEAVLAERETAYKDYVKRVETAVVR